VGPVWRPEPVSRLEVQSLGPPPAFHRADITWGNSSPGWLHRYHAHRDEPGRRPHFYNQRGTAEQWINQGKAATHCTRLSYHRFRANEVRLLLGVIAYNLGNLLRRLVLPLAIQSWSLTSLRQRLFKTGGRLIRHARYFILQRAESYLTPTLFRQIVGRIERLAWHPT
jgi:hypothetical protein